MKISKGLGLMRRTRALEGEIDQFHDLLSQSALIFKSAIYTYLEEGCSSDFQDKLQQVNKFESMCDTLRRTIETQLYTQTLIPESRGDVLGLIENLDRILGFFEGTLWGLSIEKPDIPAEFHDGYRNLTNTGGEAVEAMVLASRAFFRNIDSVGDHSHKVMFFEKEADKISTKLKSAIFDSKLDLAHKMHLKHFVEQIDNAADWAEDVADRLAIYVIKRTF
jgi:predicted phosphate transport protein (TIGR00153 family)